MFERFFKPHNLVNDMKNDKKNTDIIFGKLISSMYMSSLDHCNPKEKFGPILMKETGYHSTSFSLNWYGKDIHIIGLSGETAPVPLNELIQERPSKTVITQKDIEVKDTIFTENQILNIGKTFRTFYLTYCRKMDIVDFISLSVCIMDAFLNMYETKAGQWSCSYKNCTDNGEFKGSCYVVMTLDDFDDKDVEKGEVISIDYTAPKMEQYKTSGRINAALNGNEKILALNTTKKDGKIIGLSMTVAPEN